MAGHPYETAKRGALLRAQERLCAFPLESVIEVMRPLPIEPLPDVPAYVLGASLVRGLPTPIVDLGALLGTLPIKLWRFVTVHFTLGAPRQAS